MQITVQTEALQKYSLITIAVLLVAIVLGGFLFFHNLNGKYQEALVMSQQQMQDIQELKSQLNISKQNAEMLAAFAEKVQTGQVKPSAQFTVTASSNDAAASQVAQRINEGDTTLPAAALEDSDNTIVVPNNSNNNNGVNSGSPPQQQIGVAVYKNNNYRNWEWSAGIGRHNGDTYIPIELQRNYSKDSAISAEVHVSTKGTVSGGELKYVKKTDKLFFLF